MCPCNRGNPTNRLNAYDDARYSTVTKRSSFYSFYDDHTYGGSVEFGTKISDINTLKVALHLKEDIHKEHNLGEPTQHSQDRTTSISIEDTHKLTSKLDLVTGASYDTRKGKQAQKYDSTLGIINYAPTDTSAFNPQAGLIYHTSETGNAYFTIARKSRFPTIKNRYSGGLGSNIPNPSLDVERATNYQLGFSEKLNPKLRVEAAIFYSEITDMMQSVPVPGTVCGTSTCNQVQNVGDVRTKGIELGITNFITDNLEIGGNYTYTHRENKSNPSVKLTEVPLSKFFAYAKWAATPKLNVIGNAVYRTHQYTGLNGVFRDTPAFTVANAKISYAIQKDVTIEAGVNNLFDRNYAYTEGFYEEGRNLFANLNYRF